MSSLSHFYFAIPSVSVFSVAPRIAALFLGLLSPTLHHSSVA